MNASTTSPRSGGVAGNERLTAMSGAVLLVLIAIELATTPHLQPLLSVHVFVGVLLLGPLTVKLGSTGWRFSRYYMRSALYRRKGAPRLGLRILAPVFVLTTIIVVATGVALLVVGPNQPGPFQPLHVISSVLWVPLLSIHVAAYFTRTRSEVTEEFTAQPRVAGWSWRVAANVVSLVAGLVAAVLLYPASAPWFVWIDQAGHSPGPGFFVVSMIAGGIAVAIARPFRE